MESMINKEHAEFVQGLSDLLAWYKDHPDAPIPYSGYAINLYVSTKKEIADAARILAPCDKDMGEGYFCVRRAFGPINLEIYVSREVACTKYVIGVEHVPERIVPAHAREIVKWDCPESLLRGE